MLIRVTTLQSSTRAGKNVSELGCPSTAAAMNPSERQLVGYLTDLRRRAGAPSARSIARSMTNVSHTTINEILNGSRLASWDVVKRLGDYLDADPEELSSLWHAAATQPRSVQFRTPSEGAQRLVVNLYTATLIMKGRSPERRIAERLITSQHDGLEYLTSQAFGGGNSPGRVYLPTRAIWGCRAEPVEENGLIFTRLWLPRPLRTGERAFLVSEVLYEPTADSEEAWTNVEVDSYGIDPGELRHGALPVAGLTIRVHFDGDELPTAVWWYAEQNERERYEMPPAGSPRRLDIVGGDVTWTFLHPCQPRESYGIAYRWF